MTGSKRASRWRWVMTGVAAVAVVAAAGPFIYIHLVEGEAPTPLAVAATPSTTQTAGSAGTSSAASLSGPWKLTSGSQAGYRVKEVLLGQAAEAVGRTSDVTGQMTVQGTEVTSASFSVDLTTVQSDKSQRDGQFQGRIMETSTYPTAMFTLTSPVALESIPADGARVTVKASGKLTLHGTTRLVTVDLTARRSGAAIRVSGQIPVRFADWDIPNPNFGPVTTEDNGQIEFLLVFAHA